MHGQAVEPIPRIKAQIQRRARQIAMIALPIAPLPFRTSHRHGEPRFVVTRITASQRLQMISVGLLIQPVRGHNDRLALCLSRWRFISVSSSDLSVHPFPNRSQPRKTSDVLAVAVEAESRAARAA
jgi:hypothetical protein